MANSMPIPRPPRTPTPPSDQESPYGLGLDGISPGMEGFNPNALSPYSENLYSGSNSSLPSLAPATSNPLSPVSANVPTAADKKGPFNFQSQTLDLTKSPVTRSSVGQRRGHKYKHSSVSANIFLEPAPKAPLTIPASLPIPTLVECWRSMNKSQMTRLWWCAGHVTIAALVLYAAGGSLAQTALSHLILYDALGALLVVTVDVLSNFDVWKRSSVRHPFGLQRAEVLAGFAMSVLLLFMGFDLVSHTAQHMLEGLGTHEPHIEHEHERVSAGEVDAAALCAFAATMVSALVLQNHGRIGKVLRFAYLEHLPGVLSNPSHFLTLLCSALLLILPLLSIEMYNWLDRAISGTIALAMCALGLHLVHILGMMLLMSFNGKGVGELLSSIEADQSVSRIEEAKFWQVHYGLNIANLKLRVRGTDDDLMRLRDKVTNLVRNRLGGGYGSGGGRWEVSTQMIAENF